METAQYYISLYMTDESLTILIACISTEDVLLSTTYIAMAALTAIATVVICIAIVSTARCLFHPL